jgi:hypothetical protein
VARSPRNGAAPSSLWERIVAVVVAVWIIALVSWLILQSTPMREDQIYFLKILLALSVAVFLASLPGYLNLKYDIGGLAVRAGGALAAFIFVYTQAPNVPQLHLQPPPAVMSFDRIPVLDFRALDGPDPGAAAESPVAITVPLAGKNMLDGSFSGTIKGLTLSFDLGGNARKYDWYYFVTLTPGTGGSWISSEDVKPAAPIDVKAGSSFYQEVMTLSARKFTWSEFLAAYLTQTAPLKIDIVVRWDDKEDRLSCTIANPSRLAAVFDALEGQSQRRAPAFTEACVA